jgi:hypothetical protein
MTKLHALYQKRAGKKASKTYPFDIARYIRMDDNECLHTAIVTLSETNKEGNTITHGAFYGYAGGGVFEQGYFTIDNHADEPVSVVTDLDDIRSQTVVDQYEALMGIIYNMLGEGDDPPELSEEGQEALSKMEMDDEVAMDDRFDGDSLAMVSEQWPLTLRFED